jgi:hypothetical protein
MTCRVMLPKKPSATSIQRPRVGNAAARSAQTQVSQAQTSGSRHKITVEVQGWASW